MTAQVRVVPAAAIMVALLTFATSVTAQSAPGTAADWTVEEAIQKIEERLWQLHTQHPDLVPPPAQENGRRPHLQLHDQAAQLGEARARIALGLEPGKEPETISDDMMARAHETYRASSLRTDEAITQWANASLPAPGDVALEDAWAVIQAAFQVSDARMWLGHEGERSRLQNASQLLSVVRGVEASIVMLDAMAPVWDNRHEPPMESNLTRADIEQLRTRIHYDPGTTDAKVARLDEKARERLAADELQMALAYTLLAETANTNRRAYDAVFQTNYDLLPDLRRQHAWWRDEPPSLLLLHARELGDAVLEAAPENATASRNNLGIAAAEALARYSTVTLLRGPGDGSESMPSVDGSAQESPAPTGFVLMTAVVVAAAFLRREGRQIFSHIGPRERRQSRQPGAGAGLRQSSPACDDSES